MSKNKGKFWNSGAFNNLKGMSSDPAYSTWSSNIKRCFSLNWMLDKSNSKGYRPSYILASCSEDFKDFEKYYNYYKENYREGYVCDKDILFPHNKHYSFETCCFVPEFVNMAFVVNAKKGNLPIGVSADGMFFKMKITIDGKIHSTGCFVTADLAHKEWQRLKYQSIVDIANRYVQVSTTDGMYNQIVFDRIMERANEVKWDHDNGYETFELNIDGVERKGEKFLSYIMMQGEKVILDVFDTIEEAHGLWQDATVILLEERRDWWLSNNPNDSLVENHINAVIQRLQNDRANGDITLEFYKV
ncbi:hypothetical protein CBW54_00170 [Yersinia kristensenii]|nr:hypothetical protein CBW54_00170 [Yersinia kristensenii]